MKRTKIGIGIIFLTAVMVCNTCTKDETVMTPDGELYVLKSASISKYVPGNDITEQLRNDIEAGLDVEIPAGHFYLSETILTNYLGGSIEGAGKDRTFLEASPGFKPQPNPAGALVTCMINVHAIGDITVKDLTFIVNGEHPAEGHINPFVGYSTNIDNVIVIRGENIFASVKDIRIVGEYIGNVEGAYRGYNIIYPIIGTGMRFSGPLYFEVLDCEIENSGSAAIEYFVGNGGTGEFKDNKVSNADFGVWLGWGHPPGRITIEDCIFENIQTLVIHDLWIGPQCYKDNTHDGEPMTDDCL